MRTPQMHADADAALAAYRELGPEYGDAVVDSFIDQIDQRLAARQYQLQRTNYDYRNKLDQQLKSDKSRHFWYFVSLLIAAIPLSAIAADMAGIIGLLIAWVGLVAIAFTAFSTIPKRPRELDS